MTRRPPRSPLFPYRPLSRSRGLFPASPAERPAQPRQRLDLLRRELSERWPQTLARFRSEFERVAGVFHRVTSASDVPRSEEHTSELQSQSNLVCRLLLEKKK